MVDPLDIAHLLRRTEFAARPARVAALSAMTLADAVDDVMNVSLNPAVVTPSYLTWQDTNDWWGQYEYMYYWWLGLMLNSPRPFVEKMTVFWHGHFVSELAAVESKPLMVTQNQLFRTMALGNFRTLTQQVAIGPAMLIYLNGANSVKGAPNENFGRELMELFTLGVGNYTQDDVAAAARAWTGHNATWPDYLYVFNAAQHDNTNKTFFGQTRNWDGPDIINEILRDNAAKQLIAAKFIARKLWEYLAYLKPAQSIVDDLAAIFVANDMEVRPVLRAILTRPEFYSVAAKQGLLRSPLEWAMALCITTGRPPDDSGLGLAWASGDMGQTMFDPPNVAGWKSNSAWINTVALSGRANVARRISFQMRSNGGFDETYTMTPSAAVDHVAQYFQIDPLSTSTRTALIGALTAERAPGGNGWFGVTNLLTSIMMSPELHLA